MRHSGVPFAVVRPCALTEEPAGAELQLSQGDTIKVTTCKGYSSKTAIMCSVAEFLLGQALITQVAQTALHLNKTVNMTKLSRIVSGSVCCAAVS